MTSRTYTEGEAKALADAEAKALAEAVGDYFAAEYIKWCKLPWWRRAIRRIFCTGLVFAGHDLPKGHDR